MSPSDLRKAAGNTGVGAGLTARLSHKVQKSMAVQIVIIAHICTEVVGAKHQVWQGLEAKMAAGGTCTTTSLIDKSILSKQCRDESSLIIPS